MINFRRWPFINNLIPQLLFRTYIIFRSPLNLRLICRWCWSFLYNNFLIFPDIGKSRITSKPILFCLYFLRQTKCPLKCIKLLISWWIWCRVRFNKLSRCVYFIQFGMLLFPIFKVCFRCFEMVNRKVWVVCTHTWSSVRKVVGVL